MLLSEICGKIPLSFAALAMLTGCGSSQQPAPVKPAASKVKVNSFYVSPNPVPKGGTGNICYGVESAAKVTLDPPVAEVWPAMTRCFTIQAEGPKKYTLTAIGADGQTDAKTLDFETAEVVAAPRMYDLSINSLAIRQGEPVKLCFKAQNAVNREASPGTWDSAAGCLTDYPKATTTYKIAAVAKDGQRDSRSITVKVR